MTKSRTGSAAGEALASPPVATVQVPLPLLDVLADTRTAFFGLCLDAGEQVLRTMMEHDRERVCGPKNVPNPARRAYRHGQTPGEVTLGGRRIHVPRLRARSVDGHELDLPSFGYAAHRDPLDARTLEAIAIGVTTRKYRRALDPLPAGRRERAVSKSSVSRRFVALTSAQLATWLARPLNDLSVRVLIVDGLHFRDHVVLLALGVDLQGQKHILALREGTTENATICKALLTDLRERGLDLDQAILFVIDGGTGLRKAIRETCGSTALIQRCQVHKRRNVLEHLPQTMRPRVRRVLDEAYGLADGALAKRRLLQLAAALEQNHHGAAASLREGLDETLTLQRLGVTGALYRTLRSPNAIENLRQPGRRRPASSASLRRRRTRMRQSTRRSSPRARRSTTPRSRRRNRRTTASRPRGTREPSRARSTRSLPTSTRSSWRYPPPRRLRAARPRPPPAPARRRSARRPARATGAAAARPRTRRTGPPATTGTPAR